MIESIVYRYRREGYFRTPLPPAGPLLIEIAYPHFDIPAAPTTIDLPELSSARRARSALTQSHTEAVNSTTPRDLPLREVLNPLTVSTSLSVNDATAGCIENISVFSTGIAFAVNVKFRQQLAPGNSQHGDLRSSTAFPSLQLTGFYSDGRKATNTTDFRAEPADPTNRSSYPHKIRRMHHRWDSCRS